MGVGELREAFNSVSQPNFNCTMALLDYDRHDGKEWQILKFRGTGSDGGPFEVTSEDLGANYDLNQAARETAQRMLDLVAKGTTAK